MTLGIGLQKGPSGVRALTSEVPMYRLQGCLQVALSAPHGPPHPSHHKPQTLNPVGWYWLPAIGLVLAARWFGLILASPWFGDGCLDTRNARQTGYPQRAATLLCTKPPPGRVRASSQMPSPGSSRPKIASSRRTGLALSSSSRLKGL